MNDYTWKKLKIFCSRALSISTFANNMIVILSSIGGLSLSIYEFGIDDLWKLFLGLMIGWLIGFLSKPIFTYVNLKFHFIHMDKKKQESVLTEKVKEKLQIKLWNRGSGAIFTCYGDLFAIARHDTEYKKFVVIPVNTTFDTIVEDAGTQQQAPLVSPNTLHGMWIRNHSNYGLTIDDIQVQIEHSLHGEKVVRTISREQKPRGNCREYDIGTIAAVEGTHNTIFLLVALSAFDKKNRAHAGEDDIITVIKNIVHYCDTYGQQAPVYLPVMGTGLSRTHLTKDRAFHVISNAIQSCANEVNEKYTIVIYPGDREAISLEGAAE